MGPENSSGPFVAYFDGQPVELAQKPIQFTVAHLEDGEIVPDYSAGGVSAEDVAEAMGNMAAAMAGVSITVEVAAEGLRACAHSLELAMAMHLARIVQPGMAHRYLHTKKNGPARNTKSGSWLGFGRCSGKCSD